MRLLAVWRRHGCAALAPCRTVREAAALHALLQRQQRLLEQDHVGRVLAHVGAGVHADACECARAGVERGSGGAGA